MKTYLGRVLTTGAICAGMALIPSISSAQLVVNGVHPTDPTVTAQATFTIVGSELHVLLQATGTAANDNFEVLTGLLWVDNDIDGFTRISADLGPGSTLINNDGSAFGGTNNLGGTWAYQDPNAPAPAFFTDSVGAVGGDGTWGPVGNFPAAGGIATNLNGVNWGIVNGVSSFGGNQEPFANNSVLFKFGDIDNLSLTAISNVTFNWGSGFSSTNLTPEPGSIAMLAAGGLPILGLLRRRRNR